MCIECKGSLTFPKVHFYIISNQINCPIYIHKFTLNKKAKKKPHKPNINKEPKCTLNF